MASISDQFTSDLRLLMRRYQRVEPTIDDYRRIAFELRTTIAEWRMRARASHRDEWQAELDEVAADIAEDHKRYGPCDDA